MFICVYKFYFIPQMPKHWRWKAPKHVNLYDYELPLSTCSSCLWLSQSAGSVTNISVCKGMCAPYAHVHAQHTEQREPCLSLHPDSSSKPFWRLFKCICIWEICSLLLLNRHSLPGREKLPFFHCLKILNKTYKRKPQRAKSIRLVAFIMKRQQLDLRAYWRRRSRACTYYGWQYR